MTKCALCGLYVSKAYPVKVQGHWSSPSWTEFLCKECMIKKGLFEKDERKKINYKKKR